MSKKIRLDEHVLKQENLPSLQVAQALIMAGDILVNEQKITKPGTPVSPDSTIRNCGKKSNYVSRGGDKLKPVFNTFGLNPKDKVALDIGISTGGFTDYLRQHHTKWVCGIDVGYGQVAMKLQQDPNVLILERCNARHLTPESFKSLIEKKHPPSQVHLNAINLVVMDVSFISVTKLLPTIAQLTQPDTNFVILIKPQFEALKSELPKGAIITDDTVRQTILNRTQTQLETDGFILENKCEAGIVGTKGNQEYFFHLKKK